MIFPGAKHRPLAATMTQPRMTRHDIVCLHTMVGNLSGTDTMFKRNGYGGTESHFGIGGKWGADTNGRNLDGTIYQWVDTAYRADANLEGNGRLISIETADNAPMHARDIQPWTPRQLDAIVRVTAWACKQYDIPAVLIPDSKPGRRGIGYHWLGCEHSLGVGRVPGFLVKGGERWSNAVGKECPGPARIAQIPGIVERVARVLAGGTPKPAPAPKPAPTPEEQPMTKAERALLIKELLAAKLELTEAGARNISVPGYTPRAPGDELSLEYFIQWGGPGLYRLLAQFQGLNTQVAALTAAVTALSQNSPDAVREAFATGVAELKTELAELDVRITLGADDVPNKEAP